MDFRSWESLQAVAITCWNCHDLWPGERSARLCPTWTEATYVSLQLARSCLYQGWWTSAGRLDMIRLEGPILRLQHPFFDFFLSWRKSTWNSLPKVAHATLLAFHGCIIFLQREASKFWAIGHKTGFSKCNPLLGLWNAPKQVVVGSDSHFLVG